MAPVGPDVGKAQVCQTALGSGGSDQPLEVSLLVDQASSRHLKLAIGSGLVLERFGLDAELVLARHLQAAPAEKVDIGPGNALAGSRVGYEVIGAAFEWLFQDDRVVEPDDDAAGVASLHLCGEQVSAGFLKRRADGDSPVEMVGPRVQVQVPSRDRATHVLFLVLGNEARADFADLDFLPVELFGPGVNVSFDVVEQLGDENLVRFEVHLLAVAEAKFDRSACSSRKSRMCLESAPGTEDLVDLLFLVIFFIAVDFAAFFQILGGPVELQAVFEYGSEGVQGGLALAGLGVIGDGLIDLDRVEFVGQLEAVDSGSQPGDRFIIFERVESVRAGGLGAASVGDFRRVMADDGLRAELVEQESGQRASSGVEQTGICFDGLGQRPSPTLAVGLGFLKALGQAVIDGRAVGLDRRSRVVGVPVGVRIGIVIGEHVE